MTLVNSQTTIYWDGIFGAGEPIKGGAKNVLKVCKKTNSPEIRHGFCTFTTGINVQVQCTRKLEHELG